MIKKYIIFILILVFVVSFIGCNNTTDNSINNSEIDEFVNNNELFTLIIRKHNGTGDEEVDYINNLEKLLYKQGFNINIETVPYDDYVAYVEGKVQSSGNVAFLDDGISSDQITALIEGNQIKEISKELKIFAPRQNGEYFNEEGLSENTEYNENIYRENDNGEVEIYGVPFGRVQGFDYYSVLVKKDIAEEYGKDIDTLEDYDELLKYINDTQEEFMPGLFPITVPMANVNYMSPYNMIEIYADLNGYSDIAGLLGRLKPTSFYYYKNFEISSLNKTDTIDVITAAEIPGLKEYIYTLAEWKQEGLIDYWTWRNYDDINPYDYATIITNTYIYMKPECIINSDITKAKEYVLVNAKDYNMYLFNKADMRYSTAKTDYPYSACIYISNNTVNTKDILRFIEWIYYSEENYNLFMYGVENTDYIKENNIISYIGDNTSRANWGEAQFSIFKNYQLEYIRDYYPNNWEEILTEISRISNQNEISINKYVKDNSEITDEKIYELTQSLLEGMYKTPFFEETSDLGLISKTNSQIIVKKMVDSFIERVVEVSGVIDLRERLNQYIKEMQKYLE